MTKLKKMKRMIWLVLALACITVRADNADRKMTATNKTELAADDPVGHLFKGDKDALRPLFEQVVAAAKALGSDVEIAPKKANVSLRRRKQFALLQPTTRTRLDLGLILRGTAPRGRLEPSGSFNAMFTHRVKLAVPADLDAELLTWLKDAYDEAV